MINAPTRGTIALLALMMEISSEELTKLCLARIAALDTALNSFIALDAESALAQARACIGGEPPGLSRAFRSR